MRSNMPPMGYSPERVHDNPREDRHQKQLNRRFELAQDIRLFCEEIVLHDEYIHRADALEIGEDISTKRLPAREMIERATMEAEHTGEGRFTMHFVSRDRGEVCLDRYSVTIDESGVEEYSHREYVIADEGTRIRLRISPEEHSIEPSRSPDWQLYDISLANSGAVMIKRYIGPKPNARPKIVEDIGTQLSILSGLKSTLGIEVEHIYYEPDNTEE